MDPHPTTTQSMPAYSLPTENSSRRACQPDLSTLGRSTPERAEPMPAGAGARKAPRWGRFFYGSRPRESQSESQIPEELRRPFPPSSRELAAFPHSPFHGHQTTPIAHPRRVNFGGRRSAQPTGDDALPKGYPPDLGKQRLFLPLRRWTDPRAGVEPRKAAVGRSPGSGGVADGAMSSQPAVGRRPPLGAAPPKRFGDHELNALTLDLVRFELVSQCR
jgi:hypothetical protein